MYNCLMTMNVLLFIILLFIMPSILEPSTEEIVESTFSELQKINAGVEKDDKPVVTKGTAAVYATMETFSIGSRNVDAGNVIEDAMAIIFDVNATKTAKKAAKKNLESVRAYLECSGEACHRAAKTLAPMSQIDKVHGKDEAKKRQRVKASIEDDAKKSRRRKKPKELPEVLLLNEYVEAQKDGKPSLPTETKESAVPPRAISPETENKRITRSSAAKQSSSKSKEETITFTASWLPKPESGQYYTKTEVIKVINNAVRDDSHGPPPIRAHVIKAIVSANYVPVQHRTIERLVKSQSEGKVIVDSDAIGHHTPSFNTLALEWLLYGLSRVTTLLSRVTST